MAETFYGPWSVVVFSNNTPAGLVDIDFYEQFIIAGSDASDGVYPGVPGSTLVTVSGQAWTIAMEHRIPIHPTWYPTKIHRSSTYTIESGLMVYLSAAEGHVYTNMILMCLSLNPAHNPMVPIKPYDFTVSEEAMSRYRRSRANVRDDPRPHMARTFFTSVGSEADSPESLLKSSPTTDHDA